MSIKRRMNRKKAEEEIKNLSLDAIKEFGKAFAIPQEETAENLQSLERLHDAITKSGLDMTDKSISDEEALKEVSAVMRANSHIYDEAAKRAGMTTEKYVEKLIAALPFIDQWLQELCEEDTTEGKRLH